MSYKEKGITVSLVSNLIIFIYFCVRWLRMYQAEGLDSRQIFILWGTVILATILLNVLGNILTMILVSILDAIQAEIEGRKGPMKFERAIEDERDKLIDLKGTKVSYIVFSIGVFGAMLSFVLGQPPLIMFSLIVFFSIVAGMSGDIFQLRLYRKGVNHG